MNLDIKAFLCNNNLLSSLFFNTCFDFTNPHRADTNSQFIYCGAQGDRPLRTGHFVLGTGANSDFCHLHVDHHFGTIDDFG